ncbi:helix-turn-helix domain-containing protein [Streptomyces hirsutus]|uniref:helix-turn-helix domain-containing protein n=1 Tax=Streptomyces hirsutus TaxID=35620 RepID=UPI0006E21DC4|nr:helix-turn-helix transcriptional regulator [Streptomyces hirsutus]
MTLTETPLPDPAVEMFDALLTAKENSGKTYGQLAKLTKVSRSSVHHYFSGMRWPPLPSYLELIYRMGEDPLQGDWVSLYRKAAKSVDRPTEPVEKLEEKLAGIASAGKRVRYMPMSGQHKVSNIVLLRSVTGKALIAAFLVLGATVGLLLTRDIREEALAPRDRNNVCEHGAECGDLGADDSNLTDPDSPSYKAVVKPNKVAVVYWLPPYDHSPGAVAGHLRAGTRVTIEYCLQAGGQPSWMVISYKGSEAYVESTFLKPLDDSPDCESH